MRTPPRLLALALALPLTAAAAPITLDEALALAARDNPDLGLARAARDAAGADLYGSYAGILPRLDLTGAFGREFRAGRDSVEVVPIPIRGGADPQYLTDLQYLQNVVSVPETNFGSYAVNLTLRWTLFDGLSAWRAIAAARSASAAAGRSLDEAALQAAFAVTSRFYEVLKQERSLRVRQEAAGRSEALLQRAEALYQAGRASKGDTFTARVNLGSDRIAVEAQRAQLARARADLAVALGADAGRDLELVPPAALAGPGLPPGGEPPPLELLLERGRRARPLIAARRASAEAADATVGQARGAYWPVLGLQGSYARQGPELTGPNGAFGDLSRQYTATAQVTLAWNLFNGRRHRADEQKAAVLAGRARVDLAAAEQQVAAEVARARASVVTLSRSAALAQDNLVAAEEGLRLARERLEAGAASQLEVRDATQKLAEAQLALVSALVDHAVATADLNRAVGGTL